MPKQGPMKWPLPEIVHPASTVCFQIQVPNERHYLGAFYGAMYLLSKPYAWGDDPAHTALEVGAVWRAIFDGLLAGNCNDVPPILITGGGGDEEMAIRQNPDNPCEIQSSQDGIHWCTFIDLSLCENFGQQPGDGSTPPPAGGGTQQTCALLHANQTLLLPTLVSTGDTILLQSADGSGWDGGEFIVGPTWRLPNGDQFVGGLDVGLPVTDGGDPVPTANHMSLIAGIGGTPIYIALVEGTSVTVPSGVSNAQVWLQVNDSAIGNNQGNYNVCVLVTNNQEAGWVIPQNLALTPGSWTTDIPGTSGTQSEWLAGLGWQEVDCDNLLAGSGRYNVVFLHLVFTNPTTIKHFDMHFDAVIGDLADSGHQLINIKQGATDNTVISSVPTTADGQILSWDGELAGATEIILLLYGSDRNDTTCPPTGSARLYEVNMSGIGTPPL